MASTHVRYRGDNLPTNMATIRVKPQFMSPAKTFIKITAAAVVVYFILNKILNGGMFEGGDISAVDNAVDQKIQQFDKGVVSHHAQNSAAKDQSNGEQESRILSENELNKLWSFSEKQPENSIYVMIPFANAKSNPILQVKFETCVSSMSDLSSAPIVMFVVGDAESRSDADRIVKALRKKNVQLVFVDLKALGQGMQDVIETMQQHFSYKPGSYYSHTLFFLSIAIHRLAPPTLTRLIMLDADLKFTGDVKSLHQLFDQFSSANVMGLAWENQPVYRHVLSLYRTQHPGTRAGDPPPKGLPGFNSGVLLMDLERMRRSERYNKLLDSDVVKELAEKYIYKGHLGDQDFYSLVALENEDLFYVLPCTWNRQLCQWWRDKGYEDVFDSYFACSGKVNIYHGNCNTPFPKDV